MGLLDRLRAAWYRWRLRRAVKGFGLSCEEATARIEDFAARWQEATKGSRVIIGPPDG